MAHIPDDPAIRAAERTGYAPGHKPEYPSCPVCGKNCETIYTDNAGNIFGCDVCIKQEDAWEVENCFPEKETR